MPQLVQELATGYWLAEGVFKNQTYIIHDTPLQTMFQTTPLKIIIFAVVIKRRRPGTFFGKSSEMFN